MNIVLCKEPLGIHGFTICRPNIMSHIWSTLAHIME